MNLMQCNCGRSIEHLIGHNRYHTQFCSHYCYHYNKNPQAHPLVRVSDSKHHKNIWMRPHLKIPCDWCATDVVLKDHEKHGNRLFCSRKCSLAVRKKKNGLRDFQILKLLEFHGWQTSDGLQSLWSNSNQMLTSRSIAAVLKVYVARGIVFQRTSKDNYREYTLNPNLPDTVAKVVFNKLRCD
tara:strand:- start:4283 stop:4831 length:549 start_codon:yes stop_codon:yes gene_type:complete